MTLAQEVKNRLDIVDMISGYVALERSGRNFRAACPFHDEKTPSFFVFPERQTWRCFGACADGGDSLSFIMKAEGMEFSEALNKLAAQLGLSVPTHNNRNLDKRIYQLNHLAMEIFQRTLKSPEGYQATEYLRNRGINDTSKSIFQIGLSSPGRDTLIKHLSSEGYTDQEILNSGLATQGSDGNLRDMFQRRIMFPIHNANGQITGFGGRSIDNSNPKYINTPKSQVFDKGSLLYGLYFARNAIAEKKQTVIVEGYLDVITAHQHQFQNVVASMGTALTEQQVKMLRNICSDFVLALDPDNAGKEATIRSMESSWQATQIDILKAGRNSRISFQQRHLNVSLKVAALPMGQDPDTLIQSNPERWRELIETSQSLLDYLFETIPSRYELDNDNGKLMLVDSLGPFIRTEANPFTRSKYLRSLSRITSIAEKDLEKHIWQPIKSSSASMRQEVRNIGNMAYTQTTEKRDILEEYCLYLLLTYPELISEVTEIYPDMFEQSENRNIFTNLDSWTTIERLKESMADELAAQLDHIVSMDIPPLDIKERIKALTEIANRIKARFYTLQEQILLEKITESDWQSQEIIDINILKTQTINQELRKIYSGENTEQREIK